MKILRGALITLVTLAVTALLAEVVLRLTPLRLDHASIHELDPELIFRQLPNAEKRTSVGTPDGVRRVVVRTNSAGFRGEELERPPSSKRVVVYGDSFIAAEFSALEDTFVERLEAELAARHGTRVEAINAGVISYGPDQAFVKMREELPALHPDLIVFAVFAGNDFGDLLRNKMFRVAEDGRLRANEFEVSDSLQRSVEGARSPWLLQDVLRDARKRLRSRPPSETPRHPPVDYWLKQRREEYRSYASGADDTVTNAIFDSFDVDMSLHPSGQSAHSKEQLMGALLDEVRQIADAAGVPIVFLVIPSALDVDTSRRYSWTIDEIEYPGYDRDALCAAVMRCIAATGSEGISLLEPFRALDVNEIYFDWRDGHWNDEGQRVAAELVSSYVHAQGLLGP